MTTVTFADKQLNPLMPNVAYTQHPVALEPGHLGHWNCCQLILRSTLA